MPLEQVWDLLCWLSSFNNKVPEMLMVQTAESASPSYGVDRDIFG